MMHKDLIVSPMWRSSLQVEQQRVIDLLGEHSVVFSTPSTYRTESWNYPFLDKPSIILTTVIKCIYTRAVRERLVRML